MERWRARALPRRRRANHLVDGHGHALGSTQTRYAQPLPFSTLIETYLELPDWPQRFANWRARRRLETLTTCAKRAAETGHGPDALSFHELKREYVYNGVHPQTFLSFFEASVTALVQRHEAALGAARLAGM